MARQLHATAQQLARASALAKAAGRGATGAESHRANQTAGMLEVAGRRCAAAAEQLLAGRVAAERFVARNVGLSGARTPALPEGRIGLTADSPAAWAQGLSQMQKDALARYQENSNVVNGPLRSRSFSGPEAMSLVALLDDSMTFALADETFLYRGMYLTKGIRGTLGDFARGGVITDRGYMSTSRNAERANSFAWPGGREDPFPVILRIRAPAGTRCAPAYAFEDFNQESEVILPRDTHLRLGSPRMHRSASGRWILLVDAEVSA